MKQHKTMGKLKASRYENFLIGLIDSNGVDEFLDPGARDSELEAAARAELRWARRAKNRSRRQSFNRRNA